MPVRMASLRIRSKQIILHDTHLANRFYEIHSDYMIQKELRIRIALQADLSIIDEIYNQAIALKATGHLSPISWHERKDWLAQHVPDKRPVFVAELDDKVVGWLSISSYRPGRMALRFTAEISYYIHKDYCNKGIGTQLIRYALHMAPSLNLRQVFAIVLEHNTASIRLLKRFNFQQWGFLPDVADFDGKKCGQYYFGLTLN